MNKKNVFSDLRSLGLMGKKPIIGLTMFVIGILIFTIITYNVVTSGPLIQWDLPLAESFHSFALSSPVFVIDIMIFGYYIGKWGIVAIAIILGLYFLYKKLWREFFMVVTSIGFSGLIFLLLSNIFMRPRPFLLFDKMVWPGSPDIPGFPSGHTLSIVVCCGLLIYLLMPKIKSYLGKVIMVLIALLIIIFIGFSRLYVGDHYLTDVIAGYALGFAWFGLSCTIIEMIFQKYEKKDI